MAKQKEPRSAAEWLFAAIENSSDADEIPCCRRVKRAGCGQLSPAISSEM